MMIPQMTLQTLKNIIKVIATAKTVWSVGRSECNSTICDFYLKGA